VLDASTHRLGFAVKVLGEGGLPSHDTRRWSSGPHLRHSLTMVREIVAYLDRHDLRMYRLASALAPYASHPDLPQFHDQVRECAQEVAELGGLIRATGIRVSSHPGQYTVLNSMDLAVQAAAAAELEVQASLLDAMGLGEEAVVVVHVGGAVGGREAAFGRFGRGLERLSDAARARLVIENDDRSFALVDVLALAERTGLRVVWDVLHHRCLDPAAIPDAEAMAAAFATWPAGTTPKVHFSSPRLDVVERVTREGRRVTRHSVLPQLRAHADLIDPIAFEYFIRSAAGGRPFDVMLEAKAKDLALLRLRDQLGRRGLAWSQGRLAVPTAPADRSARSADHDPASG
jgi:UV DNA damage endonuclease